MNLFSNQRLRKYFGLLFAFLGLSFFSCSHWQTSNSTNSRAHENPTSRVEPTLDQMLFHLDLSPLREKLKLGIENYSPREKYAAGEALMMTGSAANTKLGLDLLSATKSETVPCIDYFKAEAFFHSGKYQTALESIENFEKSQVQECTTKKPNLYSCCPQSKYRNSSGLKKIIQEALAVDPNKDVSMSLDLLPLSKLKTKAPIVLWNNMEFLIDTGAEQNFWNLACKKELSLNVDPTIIYGGSDSLGQTVQVIYAKAGVNLFNSTSDSWSGFGFDFKNFIESYELLNSKHNAKARSKTQSGQAQRKICGIISPQRLIPTGLMVFDWDANKLLLCQGETCRKSLDIPTNCAMPLFKGRPYIEVSVNGNPPRLMLLDTGANATSANVNYFSKPIKTENINSQIKSASATTQNQAIIPQGLVQLCGAQFSIKPMAVHPEDQGWEWAESGKVGMDIISNSILSIDFGRRMLLFR